MIQNSMLDMYMYSSVYSKDWLIRPTFELKTSVFLTGYIQIISSVIHGTVCMVNQDNWVDFYWCLELNFTVRTILVCFALYLEICSHSTVTLHRMGTLGNLTCFYSIHLEF